MNHTAAQTISRILGHARGALAALAACAGMAMPTLAHAQAQVTLQPSMTLYRAFYFSAANQLLHVENVHSVSGRSLLPLPSGFSISPPQAPPLEGPFANIGANANYVIYFGLSPEPLTLPVPGNPNVAVFPLAFERLTVADKDRPIECATKGQDVCIFPKVCHCPGIAGCCCY
jgi:hypothetical protein